ncbi:MAG: Ig-like domain-containing protein [bacterium]|nr:Ig-like domain-containing protein [bacterium]
MGDASGTVSLQIANSNTGNSNQSIYRVQLTFPIATYYVSSSQTPPTGWSCTTAANVINCTTTTNPIAKGANLIFNITLTGPSSSVIPSAAANVTDSLSAAAAYDNTGAAFARQGVLPAWTRNGLAAQLSAAPGSVGIDGTITLTFAVTNRTTGTQNNIVPNTMTVTPTGSATLLTGPTPTSRNLASGASGNFMYTYKAAAEGTTTFSDSARNGASTVTSPAVTSNAVAISSAQFTITTVSSEVTMGDGSGVVYFLVTNTTSSPGRSIMSIRTNFFGGGNNIYESGSGSSAPPGWNVNVVGNNAPVEYWTTDPAKAIPPGGSLIFKAEITGRPNGENPIPAAASDQNDTMADALAWGGSDFTTNPLTRQGGLPGWPRKGLKPQIFAAPGSLGVIGGINLDFLITNRSTVQQNGITPGTMLFPPGSGNTGLANWVSGPVPGTLNLASGISGSTIYNYQAATVGTVTFSNLASNGMVSSNQTSSNTIVIGNFTAELALDPVSIGSGYNVTVSMRVTNNGTISLGNIVPSALTFLGTASKTLQSGPSPESIASLPPGGSGTFTWIYQVNGVGGDTYQFQGDATANGPTTTNTAVSQSGQLVPYYLILNPDTVASGSVPPNWTLNLTVANNGSTPVDRMWFIVPTGFTVVSATGPGAPLGNWALTIQGNNLTFRAASAGGTGANLPVGGSATFSVVCSAVPARPENTEYVIQAVFRQGNNYLGTASDKVLVTLYEVSLSNIPAGPLPADGSSVYAVDALLTSGGTPLSGQTVSFTATSGTLSSGTAVTDGSGVARVTLTAPVSSVNTQSVVTASYLGATAAQVLYFTGYVGSNLLYIGSTLSPTSARAGDPVSFGLDVINMGGQGVSLATGSYFTFTDGTRTYTADLNSLVSIPAGATQHLIFNSQAVSGSFTLGSYFPTLYLTDGGTNNQTRSVSDAVQVLSNIPTGPITLTPVPATITANGSDTSTITSGIIHDAYGNQVLNGEYITVSTDLGTITTADADPATPGTQEVATSGGIITFVLRAGTLAGTAHLGANNSAYGGTASGSTTVALTPGPPAGTITLLPNPGAIPADGASTSTVTSDVIKDAYGNTVPDGTYITIATSWGIIISSDMDALTPGIQASTSGGMISFVVQSAIIDGIASISADDIAYGGSASGSTIISFYPSSPPKAISDLKANKSGTDLRLYWTAVTQTVDGDPTTINYYRVYRGETPNFVPDKVGFSNLIGTSPSAEYIDPWVIQDTNKNYYYLITSVNIWGLESMDSNMGFKLNRALTYYAGKTDNNWVTIPYFHNYTDAKSLCADIPNCASIGYSDPGGNCGVGGCYHSGTKVPFSPFWIGENFTIDPSQGYYVRITANSNMVLVGSHNQITMISKTFYSGKTNNNYFSLPFHHNYADAKTLCSSVPNCASVGYLDPGGNCGIGGCYHSGTKVPFTPFWIGENFALTPGMGYYVRITGNSTWQPTHY